MKPYINNKDYKLRRQVEQYMKKVMPKIDYDTEKDNCVTIRNRDTKEQERVEIEKINNYIKSKMKNFRI